MNYAITGTNRGIGLEITRQLLEQGQTVFASARNPSASPELGELQKRFPKTLRLHATDVGDETSVNAWAASLEGAAIDVLINNAGMMKHYEGLENFDAANLIEHFNVNTLGALRVTRALLPNLRGSQTRKILHVTSQMGSIHDNSSGGAYAYRMSKAALNMAAKSMAHDLAGEKFVIALMHPGWVQTDMGGEGAPVKVEASAKGILEQVAGLSKDKSGKFLDFRGRELPW